MSYVLMAAGPRLAPIWGVVREEILRGTDWSSRVLPVADAQQLDYNESSEPLASIIAQLESGAFASIQLHRYVPSAALVGFYCPNFCNESFSQWRCVVEGDPEDLSRGYSALQNANTPSLASLWVDEAADLDSAAPMVETFPWDDWRLIRASVRTAGGQWVERVGPAKSALHQEGHSGL